LNQSPLWALKSLIWSIPVAMMTALASKTWNSPVLMLTPVAPTTLPPFVRSPVPETLLWISTPLLRHCSVRRLLMSRPS
jgi:hypothetical protein